jgi:cytochrome b561
MNGSALYHRTRPGKEHPATLTTSLYWITSLRFPDGSLTGTLPMASCTDAYLPIQKALHWLMAALIFVLVPVGISIANILKPGPVTNALFEVHKSLGLTVFALALIRIAVRWRYGAPPLVPGLPAWQRTAATISHYGLYLLVVLTPLAGWTATSVCCAPVNLYWTVPVTLPVPPGDLEAAHPIFLVHNTLALTLTALVIVHVSAALYHHFRRRDETLLRMLPGAARSRAKA